MAGTRYHLINSSSFNVNMHCSNAVHFVGVENQHGTQKGLHVQLRPELSKLHKLLELPVLLNIMASLLY